MSIDLDSNEKLYKVERGPYGIFVEPDLVLQDPARKRRIGLRVSYPDKPGKLPAIVFSHGAWATNFCYYALTQHWASHGYVVIQPNHEGSYAEGGHYGDASVFAPAIRRSRIADDVHIVNHIQDLGVPALRDLIDADRLGIGGHSYGAGTTKMLAGVTLYNPDGSTENYREPRFKAAMVLSGQGRRLGMTDKGGGLTEKSYASILVPMIVITGSRDPGRLGEPVAWRIEPFDFAPPGDKYLLFIDKADHQFGGLTREAPGYDPIGMRDLPKVPAHVDYVNAASTAFWDAHLCGDEAARRFLTSGRMEAITGGAAKLTAK